MGYIRRLSLLKMQIEMAYLFQVVSQNDSQVAAIESIQFDNLVSYLKVYLGTLPDYRIGSNISYSMLDAALSAFSVFFTQSPSFLAHQNQMQQAKGKNNALSLFQVENIPSDNQIRNLLDPVSPSHLTPIFNYVYEKLDAAGTLDNYRVLNDTILIALDGVCYHSSNKISCKNCNTKKNKNGSTSYLHSAITPVIVAPKKTHVISLPPEFITPQDGHEKQDCEHEAVKRWLNKHATTYQQKGVTFLGDDLYSCQPTCVAIINAGCHFVFTCKPDSHKTLYEWMGDFQRQGEITTVSVERKHGKKKYKDTYSFVNKLPLRDSDDSLFANWCGIISTDKNGKVLYQNAFITDHKITKDNVADIVSAGRARWKIENENNNTLKTKGYNFEHNFGHGKEHLSQTLLTLNILSFLYHTALSFIDLAYQLIREKLPTRKTFFDDLRALIRYMHFESWQHIMQFMMEGLEINTPNSS